MVVKNRVHYAMICESLGHSLIKYNDWLYCNRCYVVYNINRLPLGGQVD